MKDLLRSMPIVEQEDWQIRGRCREEDPDIFFYDYNQRGEARTARAMAAKVICAACPVIKECREFALERREPYGVWGGMTEEERDAHLRKIRRNRFAQSAIKRA